MPEENGNRDTRLDRIERALELMIADHEQFRVDLKQLLTAQVLQSDDIKEHTKQILEQSKQIGQLREKDAALDERVDKLVSSIGELIGRIPPTTLR